LSELRAILYLNTVNRWYFNRHELCSVQDTNSSAVYYIGGR